jgi:hypothetical protein
MLRLVGVRVAVGPRRLTGAVGAEAARAGTLRHLPAAVLSHDNASTVSKNYYPVSKVQTILFKPRHTVGYLKSELIRVCESPGFLGKE